MPTHAATIKIKTAAKNIHPGCGPKSLSRPGPSEPRANTPHSDSATAASSPPTAPGSSRKYQGRSASFGDSIRSIRHSAIASASGSATSAHSAGSSPSGTSPSSGIAGSGPAWVPPSCEYAPSPSAKPEPSSHDAAHTTAVGKYARCASPTVTTPEISNCSACCSAITRPVPIKNATKSASDANPKTPTTSPAATRAARPASSNTRSVFSPSQRSQGMNSHTRIPASIASSQTRAPGTTALVTLTATTSGVVSCSETTAAPTNAATPITNSNQGSSFSSIVIRAPARQPNTAISTVNSSGATETMKLNGSASPSCG